LENRSLELTRRLLLGAASAVVLTGSARADSFADAMARLEATSGGGRLGVFVLDTATGRSVGHRADERFPSCSTFKFLLAAAILARIDAGREQADRRIAYTAADILDYAPAAKLHLAEGAMSVLALCEAIVTVSDNTAANLLLASLGGPAAVTAFARRLGDKVTRLDHIEPLLSTVPGDPSDTTSPAAMAADMKTILTGTVLSKPSRDRLEAWLTAATRGLDRIRAGVPQGWVVGDKAGTGPHGTNNDIAILRPPGRAPIMVTAYLTGSNLPDAARNAILAQVGRAAAAQMR
jgi:beta-lactamase class A